MHLVYIINIITENVNEQNVLVHAVSVRVKSNIAIYTIDMKHRLRQEINKSN